MISVGFSTVREVANYFLGTTSSEWGSKVGPWTAAIPATQLEVPHEGQLSHPELEGRGRVLNLTRFLDCEQLLLHHASSNQDQHSCCDAKVQETTFLMRVS
jgi:hypothetical protein